MKGSNSFLFNNIGFLIEQNFPLTKELGQIEKKKNDILVISLHFFPIIVASTIPSGSFLTFVGEVLLFSKEVKKLRVYAVNPPARKEKKRTVQF